MASVTRRARAGSDSDTSANMEERLLAALERLLDRGFTITAIAVDALAREAGIARATFYLHYRDKGQLIARLIERIEDEMVGAGGIWFAHAEDATFEDLRAAMARFLEVYREHHAILSAAVETAPYDREVASLHQRMLARFVGESAQAIERIQDSGRAHRVLPPMLAEVLAWSVNHTYVQYAKAMDDDTRDAFVDSWAHVVWHAIFASPPTAAR